MLSETVVVLVVDESAVFRSITAERLRVAGFEVVEAANFAEAEEVLKSTAVDALFLSVHVQSAGHPCRSLDMGASPGLRLLAPFGAGHYGNL